MPSNQNLKEDIKTISDAQLEAALKAAVATENNVKIQILHRLAEVETLGDAGEAAGRIGVRAVGERFSAAPTQRVARRGGKIHRDFAV